MNHRLEMEADSTSSDLKDREQAMNGHLPAHPNINIYSQSTFGNTGTHTVPLSPQIYFTVHHKAPQLAVSVVTILRLKCCGLCRTLVLLLHDSTRPNTACQCVVAVATYYMPVYCHIGHILRISMLLQWPHTAYKCVVTVATCCITVCCYSGHILHTRVLLQHDSTRPHTANHCVVAVAKYCINSVLLRHDSSRPHTAYKCVTVDTCCIPVCCYSMSALKHILHTSVLLQWPHIACKCVVTVVTYCTHVCCYSGHMLHRSVLLQWPHTAYQCVVTVATFCIPVCCYSTTALGHILHKSVFLQWPHTAYKCIVTVATYCVAVCCNNGHLLGTIVLLHWPHTAYM